MLVIMKKSATEAELDTVKEYIIAQDFDMHQSTGTNRTIIGVIGDLETFSTETLESLPGVHVVYRIPPED